MARLLKSFKAAGKLLLLVSCLLFLLQYIRKHINRVDSHLPTSDLESRYVETSNKYISTSYSKLLQQTRGTVSRTDHSTVHTQKLQGSNSDFRNEKQIHKIIPSSVQLLQSQNNVIPKGGHVDSLHSATDQTSSSTDTDRSNVRKINRLPDHTAEQYTDNKTGFVLAVHFWDQQTFSIGNILGLQGWAAWLGVHTVEPFLVGTKFGFPLGDPNAFHSSGTVSYLKMSDVYDIDDWNVASSKVYPKVSPLMPWDYFLRTASKNVIYIEIVLFRRCSLGQEIASYNETLTVLGFNLLHAHCLDIKSHTLSGVRAEIYGDLSPHKVTVVFNVWRQLNISPLTAIGGLNVRLPLKPSQKILNDAERYISKYLPPNGAYVGILVRSEWLIMNRGYIEKRKQVLQDCLKSGVDWLHAIMNQTHLSSVFVGMDIGKYGSTTLKDLTQSYILELSENFLQTTYGTSEMNIANWEKTFQGMSQSEVPGYIAFLQKTIATRGKCLLLLGYGSFQNHALKVYVDQHQQSEHCYLKTDSLCRIKSLVGITNHHLE